MSIEFQVGSQVVCFDNDSNWDSIKYGCCNTPLLNSVYTIREILISTQAVGLLFEEIHNDRQHFIDGFNEQAFNSQRFRPLKKTNIDIFTSILNKENQKGKLCLEVT